MLDVLRPVIAAVFAALILWALARVLRRSTPASLAADAGMIRPELWTAWFTVLGGLAVLVVALWAAIVKDGGWAAAAVALLGAAIAGFMAPSVTSVHAVRWNENGIEGPAKTLGPTLGTARTQMAWSDIVRTGQTTTGYWYVESHDGRRVYWSYLYKGYGALARALQRQCPTLRLPF
jgi:hypothetical protein